MDIVKELSQYGPLALGFAYLLWWVMKRLSADIDSVKQQCEEGSKALAELVHQQEEINKNVMDLSHQIHKLREGMQKWEG